MPASSYGIVIAPDLPPNQGGETRRCASSPQGGAETALTIAWLTEVDVDQGVVTLSGMVQDEAVLDSSRKVVADIPYVTAVKDHRAVPQSTWG